MKAQVIVDKPPEYRGTRQNDCDEDSGFPFDEDSGSEDVWNDLASRHPDIAARLRAGREGAWGPRKRRSSHQPDDSSRNANNRFQGFPFEDIPPEFRQHFPTHWGDRFSPRSAQQERQYPPQEKEVKVEQSPAQTSSAGTQEIATQTVDGPEEASEVREPSGGLAQHGLRNTVDLGVKTPAEPGQIDAEQARNQRSMSAPPDNRPQAGQHQAPPQPQNMGNAQQGPPPQQHQQPNIRHIPIFVEGRDEPVINRKADNGTGFASEARGTSPQPPEREPQRTFNQPPHFSKAFGTPFKGFKPAPAPFGHQRAYQQQQDDMPKVFQPTSKSPPPQRQSQPQPNPQHQQQQQSQPNPQSTQEEQSQPPKPPPAMSADPITKIQLIQRDVLNLMTEVEKFQGCGRQDKQYLYLDEMLTRNLIKLDDIDTEGKENIRQARREAIKCIQKCIAVLEAKADGLMNRQTPDVSVDNQCNTADAGMTDLATQETQNILENGQSETTPENKTDASQQAHVQSADNPANSQEAFQTNADLTPMDVDQNASSQQQ